MAATKIGNQKADIIYCNMPQGCETGKDLCGKVVNGCCKGKAIILLHQTELEFLI